MTPHLNDTSGGPERRWGCHLRGGGGIQAPITAGVDFGPGPDSTVINLPNTQPTILNVIQTIAENDPSGDAELIFLDLQNRG